VPSHGGHPSRTKLIREQEWSKLQNDKVKEDEMGRTCSMNGEKRNAYRILVGKPEGKRPLRRPRRKWVNNIKMDLKEIGWYGMDWIDLAQNRGQWMALVNTVMNLRVAQILGSCRVAAQLAASQEGLSSTSEKLQNN
jgi:hypothetical protein